MSYLSYIGIALIGLAVAFSLHREARYRIRLELSRHFAEAVCHGAIYLAVDAMKLFLHF